jgi:hypothetical protein
MHHSNKSSFQLGARKGLLVAALSVSFALGCSGEGQVSKDSGPTDMAAHADSSTTDLLGDGAIIKDGIALEAGSADSWLPGDASSADTTVLAIDGPTPLDSKLADAPIADSAPIPQDLQALDIYLADASIVDMPGPALDTAINDIFLTDGPGGLPDLHAGLPLSDCDSDLANEGAWEHWMGQFTWLDATNAIGYEQRLWFVNAKWKSIGGTDCIAHWNITGTKGAAVNCGTCDHSLTVTGQINLAKSTCDPASWLGDETFTATYDVRLNANGSSDWLFASTGNSLGTGYWNAAAENYLSPGACKWF